MFPFLLLFWKEKKSFLFVYIMSMFKDGVCKYMEYFYVYSLLPKRGWLLLLNEAHRSYVSVCVFVSVSVRVCACLCWLWLVEIDGL